MKKIILTVLVLSAALSGCSNLWREYQGLQSSGASGGTKGSVQGVVPESGATLKTVLSDGLSLLSFPGAVSNRVLGSVDSGKEYPDLFFQCTDGAGADKVYICAFESKLQDGRLVYNAGKQLSFPWGGTEAVVKVLSISGNVYALALTRTSLCGYRYNAASSSFDASAAFTVAVSGIGNTPFAFDFVQRQNNLWDAYVLCDDGSVYLPDVDKEHTLYNSANIYIGNLPYARLYTFGVDISNWQAGASASEIEGKVEKLVGPSGILRVNGGYLVGNCLSGIGWCPEEGTAIVRMMAASDGSALNNCCTITRMAAMGGGSFVCSGEGPVCWFESVTAPSGSDAPLFKPASPLLMHGGEVYAGSCSVPNVADWDGDGVLDIVSGSSDGRIAFFKNYGTNEAPAFGEPCYLQADGVEVCIRSGYYELGGPINAAYGYVSPTVIDWNGDGILDIVYSSNAIRTGIMLGTGGKAPNCLKQPMVLNYDGLDLWGRWKVRPAIVRYNGDVWLAKLDEDDALHLYKKAGLANVLDCGPLLLSDGSAITGHRANSALSTAIEQGDAKLQFTDWDGDGDPDLLLGCTSVASYPNTYQGIPWNLGTQTMQVMIFENVSTDGRFVFDYPRLFQYLRADYFLGLGEKAPVSCDFGDSRRGTNMLVGADDGKFYFFRRHDLSEKAIW